MGQFGGTSHHQGQPLSIKEADIVCCLQAEMVRCEGVISRAHWHKTRVSFEADIEECNFSQKGSCPAGRPPALYKPGNHEVVGSSRLAGGCANWSYSKGIRAERLPASSQQ